MRDVTDLPDDPSTGDDREVESVPDAAEALAELDDELVVAAVAAAPEVSSRWFPETVGGFLYLMILLVAVLAVGVTVLVDWRLGMRVFAGTLFAAALFRLVLPESKVGMLAVRSRGTDVLMHLAVGGLLVFLTSSIPDQPL